MFIIYIYREREIYVYIYIYIGPKLIVVGRPGVALSRLRLVRPHGEALGVGGRAAVEGRVPEAREREREIGR